MASEQQKKSRKNDEQNEAVEAVKSEPKDLGIDDILDEIDDVLEENAEEFVKGYIQKGGQ